MMQKSMKDGNIFDVDMHFYRLRSGQLLYITLKLIHTEEHTSSCSKDPDALCKNERINKQSRLMPVTLKHNIKHYQGSNMYIPR